MVLGTIGVIWEKFEFRFFHQAGVSPHDGFSPNAIQILKELDKTSRLMYNLSTQVQYWVRAGVGLLGVLLAATRLPTVRLRSLLVRRGSNCNSSSLGLWSHDSTPKLMDLWLFDGSGPKLFFLLRATRAVCVMRSWECKILRELSQPKIWESDRDSRCHWFTPSTLPKSRAHSVPNIGATDINQSGKPHGFYWLLVPFWTVASIVLGETRVPYKWTFVIVP